MLRHDVCRNAECQAKRCFCTSGSVAATITPATSPLRLDFMIPLRDNIPPRTFPVVNYLLIALCALAFMAQLAEQTDGTDGLVERLGMIPARVFHPDEPITIKEE